MIMYMKSCLQENKMLVQGKRHVMYFKIVLEIIPNVSNSSEDEVNVKNR